VEPELAKRYNSKPYTLYQKLLTQNPKPYTRHPNPYALNLKP